MMCPIFHAGSFGAMTSEYYPRAAAVLLRRIGRWIDNWVADRIARCERDVAGSMLHDLCARTAHQAGAANEVKSMLARADRSQG